MANIAIPHGIPAVILGALSVPNATATISSLGIAVYAAGTNCYTLVRNGGIDDAARTLVDHGFLVEIGEATPRWRLPRKAVRRG